MKEPWNLIMCLNSLNIEKYSLKRHVPNLFSLIIHKFMPKDLMCVTTKLMIMPGHVLQEKQERLKERLLDHLKVHISMWAQVLPELPNACR